MKNKYSTLMNGLGLLVLVVLCQVQQPEAAKKNDGGGGRPQVQTYSVEFTMNDDLDLTSDGGPYIDMVDGIYAEIVGSGNPLLRLGDSETRSATVDLQNCTPESTLSDEEYLETLSWLTPGIPIQGISPYGMSVDGNFLGMSVAPNDTEDSLLGIGLGPLEGRSRSIRFDLYFGGEPAEVTRLNEVQWFVSTVGRKAKIVRPALTKGKEKKVVVATCNDLRIQYTVTCSNTDENGCIPK